MLKVRLLQPCSLIFRKRRARANSVEAREGALPFKLFVDAASDIRLKMELMT